MLHYIVLALSKYNLSKDPIMKLLTKIHCAVDTFFMYLAYPKFEVPLKKKQFWTKNGRKRGFFIEWSSI